MYTCNDTNTKIRILRHLARLYNLAEDDLVFSLFPQKDKGETLDSSTSVKHARFLQRKSLIINAGFESPTVRKRCMQQKWPAGMHTICIALFTICIENLAVKWLRKVVGRWTGRIPLSGEVENHLPRQCAPHVAERLILMAGSGILTEPAMTNPSRMLCKASSRGR